MNMSEQDLHAYVDGQLDPARNAEVAAYLGANPQALARVEVYRKQNQTLHALFDPTLDEPLPAALQYRQRPRANPQWLRVAAMVGTLALGLVLGYGLRGVTAPTMGPMALSNSRSLR